MKLRDRIIYVVLQIVLVALSSVIVIGVPVPVPEFLPFIYSDAAAYLQSPAGFLIISIPVTYALAHYAFFAAAFLTDTYVYPLLRLGSFRSLIKRLLLRTLALVVFLSLVRFLVPVLYLKIMAMPLGMHLSVLDFALNVLLYITLFLIILFFVQRFTPPVAGILGMALHFILVILSGELVRSDLSWAYFLPPIAGTTYFIDRGLSSQHLWEILTEMGLIAFIAVLLTLRNSRHMEIIALKGYE